MGVGVETNSASILVGGSDNVEIQRPPWSWEKGEYMAKVR
jgi:hypothetical protein